ncbi:hypothetical protein WME82_35825 [Sorangium sp. So ce128]
MGQPLANELETGRERSVHGLRQGLQIEAHAEARCGRQQPRRLGTEVLEALRHQRADIVASGVRLRALQVSGPSAALDLQAQDALSMQGNEQLTDEERVTVGLAPHDLREPAGFSDRRAQRASHDRRDRLGGQRPERQRQHDLLRPVQRSLQAQERRRVTDITAAERGQHHHVTRVGVRQDGRQHLGRGGVEPLRIVEHEGEGTLRRGEDTDEGEEDMLQPAPRLDGVQRDDGRGGTGDAVERRHQLGHDACVVPQSCGHALPQLRQLGFGERQQVPCQAS